MIQFEIGPMALEVVDNTAWCGVENAIYVIDLDVCETINAQEREIEREREQVLNVSLFVLGMIEPNSNTHICHRLQSQEHAAACTTRQDKTWFGLEPARVRLFRMMSRYAHPTKQQPLPNNNLNNGTGS
jgi:hypothetical protein